MDLEVFSGRDKEEERPGKNGSGVEGYDNNIEVDRNRCLGRVCSISENLPLPAELNGDYTFVYDCKN